MPLVPLFLDILRCYWILYLYGANRLLSQLQ